MRAVILAGGKGTRLRPLTKELPKPMMPIIDRPILEYIILLLRKHGVREIALALGYKAEKIIRYFGSGKKLGVKLTYFKESVPLGTAGAVKNVGDFLGDDFIVMSGDALTNIDITRLVDFHMEHGGMVTMAVKRVDNIEGLGVLELDSNDRITSFIEKPSHSNSELVNMGIYVMNKRALDLIPKGVQYDFSKDLFPCILPYMYGYINNSYWSDIGTLSSYYLANNYVVTNRNVFGVKL